MTINNPICHKFYRLINDEVAGGQQNDRIYIRALEEYKVTEETKSVLGISPEIHYTFYNLFKPSVDVLSKMRLIYLVSLIEAFGQEYIVERDNLKIDDLKKHIKTYAADWQKKETRQHLNSTSFYNTPFLAFVLNKRFNISFGSDISEAFWEIGTLRKCIVHHQAFIKNEEFCIALSNSITMTNTANAVNEQIFISNEFMWTLIEDSRRFIRACDHQKCLS